MAKLITGIFKNRPNAMSTLDDLRRHGFALDDISLLMSESSRGNEFKVEEHSKSSQGMASGAAVGGVLGAIVLGLTTVGMVAAPGVGIFAVGQWLSLLAGFGAGALGGGLIGGLIGLGISEHVAELYRGEIEKGGILIGVYSLDEDRAKEVVKLFEANGAEHVIAENVKSEVDKTVKVR